MAPQTGGGEMMSSRDPGKKVRVNRVLTKQKGKVQQPEGSKRFQARFIRK